MLIPGPFHADARTGFLVAGLLLALVSFTCYQRGRYTLAVWMLFLATFAFFLFTAMLDPFLNLWDERFHALVARNLLSHPWRPTLYENPVITMPYDRWDRSLVWLHKQPFFLWQIVASYKIFGFSEFAVRFPSALLSALLVPVTYRSGKILVNRDTGYFAALFVPTSFYLVELISGHRGVDHNDVVFLFYVSASTWAWLEYTRSGKLPWLMLTGLFSGFAVLTKWLAGLVVYAGWFIYIVASKRARQDRKSWFHLATAFAITCLVVVPWQVWILVKYPAEAMAEYRFSFDHLSKGLEGSGEPWWFYLANLPYLYGIVSIVLIPAGLVLLFRNNGASARLKAAVMAMPVMVYIFYSLATSKMASFTFVVSMPLFIAMGCVLDFILGQRTRAKLSPVLFKTATFLLLAVVLAFNLRVGELIRKHTINNPDDPCPKILVENRKAFLRYKVLLPRNSVVFNLKGRSYIDCMFYTGFPSYNFIPTPGQYHEAVAGGYRVVVVNISRQECPGYLENDPSVIVLEEQTACCD